MKNSDFTVSHEAACTKLSSPLVNSFKQISNQSISKLGNTIGNFAKFNIRFLLSDFEY
jgi:hypothetical protein